MWLGDLSKFRVLWAVRSWEINKNIFPQFVGKKKKEEKVNGPQKEGFDDRCNSHYLFTLIIKALHVILPEVIKYRWENCVKIIEPNVV